MFKINKLTDYAIILLDLLSRKKSPLSALILSKQSLIPAPTVSKIMKKLAKSDFITASRGVHGGYVLSRPIEQLSIKEVLAAFDGPLALTKCLTSYDSSCAIDSCCCMKQGWRNLNDKLDHMLNTFTLDQFLPKFPEHHERK